MPKSLGVIAIIGGFVLNNFIYLQDVIADKHEGFISVGMKSGIGIAVSFLIIVAGIMILARPATEAPAT